MNKDMSKLDFKSDKVFVSTNEITKINTIVNSSVATDEFEDCSENKL